MSNKRTLEECDNFIKAFVEANSGNLPVAGSSEGSQKWDFWLRTHQGTSLKSRVDSLYQTLICPQCKDEVVASAGAKIVCMQCTPPMEGVKLVPMVQTPSPMTEEQSKKLEAWLEGTIEKATVQAMGQRLLKKPD